MQCSAMSLLCHYEIGELLFVNFSCYCWTTTLILTERKTCMNVQSKPSFQATSVIITRNSYIAPNQTRLAQSTSHFKTRMNIRINTWNACTHQRTQCQQQSTCKGVHMHTSRNNQWQRNPDMQPSNTWTMDTSHDCKSNTESITTIIHHIILLIVNYYYWW